jgi:Domain of unknown function (DUF4258)
LREQPTRLRFFQDKRKETDLATLALTDHARARMQQRGIPGTTLKLLLDYGRVVHDHRGACLVFFDRQSWRRILRERGKVGLKEAESHRNVYAVIGCHGDVRTVGHRYNRLPKP